MKISEIFQKENASVVCPKVNKKLLLRAAPMPLRLSTIMVENIPNFKKPIHLR
jgi:hypothetical protein